MKDIVVGIDRSETSRTAAGRAAELAAALRANLHIVMCVDRGSSQNFSIGSEQFHTDWLSGAEEYLAEVAGNLPHDLITQTIGMGDPAEMLCAEATRLEAQAIVVGNRRVQGMSRVLGSVAADVTRHAPCDVVVVNTSGTV